MDWTEYKREQPGLERVYLVFSPQWGYDTLMWEWNRQVRSPAWDQVTYWSAFDFLPGECQSTGKENGP